MNPVTLVIGGLAVWRLTHALVKENGPLMLFARMRAYFARTQKRSGGLFDVVSCTSCLSVWIGLVASLWVAHTIFNWVGYGLAFSGLSMLLEALFAKYTDSLKSVTGPAGDNKILVRARTTPEQRNNVVGNPDTPDGFVTVET